MSKSRRNELRELSSTPVSHQQSHSISHLHTTAPISSSTPVSHQQSHSIAHINTTAHISLFRYRICIGYYNLSIKIMIMMIIMILHYELTKSTLSTKGKHVLRNNNYHYLYHINIHILSLIFTQQHSIHPYLSTKGQHVRTLEERMKHDSTTSLWTPD